MVMNDLQKHADDKIIESLVINGDLSKLNPQDRVKYYNGFCQRLGLDPFTQPFKLVSFQGKQVLYLDRSGAQQLNKQNNLSHQITSREIIESAGIYQVTARASMPDGRFTESIGAVNIAGFKGDAYANAIMKAETKAKRRATLDLLGLGILDESEVDAIRDAKKITVEQKQEITEAETIELPEEQLQKAVSLMQLCNDLNCLKSIWSQFKSLQKNTLFAQAKEEKKKEIESKEILRQTSQ